MQKKTPRDYGLWLGQLQTGYHNDLSDVPGVLVGNVTLIRGEGCLVPGKGPVRTGITAIRPHPGNLYRNPCWAGIYVFNGFGKSVGVPFVQETGILNSPILLTNTLSVSAAAEGLLTYLLKQNPEIGNDARTPNLAVFECDDSYLNDIRGQHVKPSDAILALSRANHDRLPQGNVGAGTGMSAFQLKGGIGSSSRLIYKKDKVYVLGMLALANFGLIHDLLINGVPVGQLLWSKLEGYCPGSLILIGATNAPLSRWQLTRLAQRAFLGLARTGGISRTGSGEFSLMINTLGLDLKNQISDWEMDDFYQAVVEASAESIWNSLFLAETMEGRDKRVRAALPHDVVLKLLNIS